MNTIDRLIEKSKEAFVMSIEIYNKPTLHYRLEGFSMFICNAWELMLKAHLIKNMVRTPFITKISPTGPFHWKIVYRKCLLIKKHL